MTTQQLIELQESITQGEWKSGEDSGLPLTVFCGPYDLIGIQSPNKQTARAIALAPQLLAEVIRLRNALKPLASEPFNCDDDKDSREHVTLAFSMHEIRAARAALANDKEQ